MKRLLTLVAAVALAGMIMTGVTSEAQAKSPRDGVFIHISHGKDDPHMFLMGLQMANMMATDYDVLVFFDSSAVNDILESSIDLKFAHFPSSKEALKALRAKKVVLMACKHCLKVAGKSKEHLAKGVQIADKKAFFSFTKGRILSLDY